MPSAEALERNSTPAAEQPPPPRPTESERKEAERAIEDLKSAGLLSGKATRTEPNVIACALALRQGEYAMCDRVAKRDFGLREKSRVRQDWVDDGAKRLERCGPCRISGTAMSAGTGGPAE